MKPYWIAALLLSPLAQASAEQFEQHDAHEHGKAVLQLVGEGKTLQLALSGAAFNFYGFEHQPHTQAEQQHATQVAKRLKDVAGLFRLSGGECSLQQLSIDLPFSEQETHEHHDQQHEHAKHGEHQHEQHHEDAEHGEHQHDQHHEDAEHGEHQHDQHHEDAEHGEHQHDQHHEDVEHDEHQHEQHHEDAEHGEHKHDQHHEDTEHGEHQHQHHHEHAEHDEHQHEQHHDLQLEYQFSCHKLATLKAIELPLFKQFPELQQLDVTAFINGKAVATTLTPDNHRLSW